jgi:dienelactone hydrolase
VRRALALISIAAALPAQDLLPNSTRWDFPADIVARQYAELRAYFEAQWKRPADPPPNLADHRAFIRESIGAIDEYRKPVAQITRLGESAGLRVSLVEWPILRIGTIGPTAGFSGALVRLYGVLIEPVAEGRYRSAVFIPDAVPGYDQSAPVRIAATGAVVFVPLFTPRRTFSQVWLEDRDWLKRLAYQTGRHIVGSEVQQVIAAADWLRTLPNVDGPMYVGGVGQGGMTAILAAALDSRFTAVASHGYPESTPEWDQPPDRLLWKLRSRLAPEDIARAVGARPMPSLPPVPAGFNVKLDADRVSQILTHQFRQWEAYYRNLALESWRVRDAKWKPDFSSPDAYTKSMAAKREAYFDLIGRHPKPAGPVVAESVKVYDQPTWTGHRLHVKVYDNLHAYGILCVPKGIKPGERRPVVFVQHGLAGTPEDSIGLDPKARAEYSKFGLRLVERGYIVFASMIATQDNVERQKVVRRSHPVGGIPAGVDAVKFGRVLDYLETLPFVDKDRFAFYGLSYGGYTAVWTGPAEPRFKAVICSGHFNEWTAKTTDLTMGTAYPHYANVDDQYNFGMLAGFDHSDLASLIAPRAFMVEMGATDGVIVEPRWAADREIDQVLEVYRKLAIPRMGRVARFDGPHRIDGGEAYPFLDEVLRYSGARPK